jgi:hypothetical protein
MRHLFKRFAIALGIIGFIAVVWANRTGRLAIPRFDHGGVLTPVSEAAPSAKDATTIRVGVFAENIYDFNMATQSFAAEGLVWIHWGPAFQKLLDSEGVTIDQVVHPVNRVNSWDWMMKPFYPNPLRTESGDHYQLLRFAGRFYIDQVDLHRYPFEKLTAPIVWGLNMMSDVFSAEKVHIIADRSQSGVGSFIEVIGFATEKYEVNEYVHTYPTSFGYRDAGKKSQTPFSQVRLEVTYSKAPLASVHLAAPRCYVHHVASADTRCVAVGCSDRDSIDSSSDVGVSATGLPTELAATAVRYVSGSDLRCLLHGHVCTFLPLRVDVKPAR